jgi:hypothetical protein
MMLLMKHDGWSVLTNSWTVASKKPSDNVTVCYQWGPDQVSWFDRTVSTARVELNMTLETFHDLCGDPSDAGNILDVRSYCR